MNTEVVDFSSTLLLQESKPASFKFPELVSFKNMPHDDASLFLFWHANQMYWAKQGCEHIHTHTRLITQIQYWLKTGGKKTIPPFLEEQAHLNGEPMTNRTRAAKDTTPKGNATRSRSLGSGLQRVEREQTGTPLQWSRRVYSNIYLVLCFSIRGNYNYKWLHLFITLQRGETVICAVLNNLPCIFTNTNLSCRACSWGERRNLIKFFRVFFSAVI